MNGQNAPDLVARVDELEGRLYGIDGDTKARLNVLEAKVDTVLSDTRDMNMRLAQQSLLVLKVAQKIGVDEAEIESLRPSPDDTLITRLDKIRSEEKKERRRRNLTLHPVKTRAIDWGKYLGIAVGAIVTISISVKEIAAIIAQLAHKFGG